MPVTRDDGRELEVPEWLKNAQCMSPSEIRVQGAQLLPLAPKAILPTDSAERKNVPMASGCWDYFPAALAEVARLSWIGNEKHNPGEPMRDARGKSQDDSDCLLRHFSERGTLDKVVTKDGRTFTISHSAAVAWRALRILQKEMEAAGAPLAPGARL